MKSKLLIISMVVLFSTTIFGCNMMKGAGEDIENTGENLQHMVDKND
jgi:predicted small secreted protein